MSDVSMGEVGDLSDNEGFPLEGAVDDSALEDYSDFQGLSDQLAEDSGSVDAEEGLDEVDRGIDSLALNEREEEVQEDSTPRAQKRIQTLSGRTKELEQQLGQQQQYYQQELAKMQQYMQHQMSQTGNTNALSQQLQQQQQQLQMLQQRKQEEEYQNLTPLEQLKRDILQEAGAQSSGAVNQQVAALRKELEQEKQARANARQESERNARYAYYTQQTEQARAETLLNGFAQEDANRLSAEADEMILAYAGAFGIEPREAAGKLKAYMDNYHMARLKTRSNGEGKKVRKSRAVPKPAPAGRRQAKGGLSMPTLGQLRKAGFDSHVDWIAANEPPIA
jgi:DNA polymerase III gamma/tau subunit